MPLAHPHENVDGAVPDPRGPHNTARTWGPMESILRAHATRPCSVLCPPGGAKFPETRAPRSRRSVQSDANTPLGITVRPETTEMRPTSTPSLEPQNPDALFERWYYGQRFLDPNELTEPRLRAAAEIIGERVGRAGGQIRETDVARIAHILDTYETRVQTGDMPRRWRGFGGVELALLREKIDAIASRLHRVTEPTPSPFCVSFKPSAIAHAQTRRCAELVASLGSTGEVTSHALSQAVAILDADELPDVLRTRLQDPNNREVFTPENIQSLMIFQSTGKGGIAHGGPISINGTTFTEVHVLTHESIEPSQLGKLVQEIEEQINSSGYDRIYVTDTDGRLLLALNESGSISNIRPKMRVRVDDPDTGEFRGSGKVVLVVDVNNSLREATLGFWLELPRKITSAIHRADGESIESRIQKVLADDKTSKSDTKKSDTPEEDINPEKTKKKKTGEASDSGRDKAEARDSGTANWCFASGLGATLGTMAFSAPAAFGAIAAIGGIVTAVNIGEYARNYRKRDKSPVYHAIGVTMARPGPIRD